jgi:hypothetical protein
MTSIDPTVCPKGHEDCTEISEPIKDFMPDYMYQLWYCHHCDRTHEVTYNPTSSIQLERPE